MYDKEKCTNILISFQCFNIADSVNEKLLTKKIHKRLRTGLPSESIKASDFKHAYDRPSFYTNIF